MDRAIVYKKEWYVVPHQEKKKKKQASYGEYTQGASNKKKNSWSIYCDF